MQLIFEHKKMSTETKPIILFAIFFKKITVLGAKKVKFRVLN